jgi:arylsulfatase
MEGSLRTPFIIRWPGKIKPESVSNEIVHITDLLPTLAGVAGYKVPSDRIIDGVDQMAFFQGKTDTAPREGFPAYNGDAMQAYKWRNYKVRFIKQDSMFDAPVTLNVPEVYNLKRDPKELFGYSGGMGETGTENLTWVLPVVIKRILAFNQTLQAEAPVPFPAPEPYTPSQ